MMTTLKIVVGMRIRVTQRIERREGNWEANIEGVIEEISSAPTGSWYAHGKNDKYWLQRIRLRKDDGEISLIALDRCSRITVLVGTDDTA